MKIRLIQKDYDTSYLKELVDESVGDYLKDINEIKKVIKEFKMPNFENLYDELKNCRNVTIPEHVLDITSYNEFSKRFYKIQNNENVVLRIKGQINSFSRKWHQLYFSVNKLLQREKNKILITPQAKELKNQTIQNAYVETQLFVLIDIIAKIELVIERINHIEEEIKDTLKYLDNSDKRVSRLFSIVQEDNKYKNV